MRNSILVLLCLAATSTAQAQPAVNTTGWSPPSCEAAFPGRPYCQAPPNPGYNPPCQPPSDREKPPGEELRPRDRPPSEEYVPREVGAYVAPPRTGATRGATNYRGFELGSITLPELKLKMPSIELPHCFHGRSSARMMIDSAVAPWESQGFVNAAVGAAPPPQDRAAPSLRDTQDRAATERAACEEYSRRLKQYEDELRSIEDQRRKLEDCIRQCLEANRSAPVNLPRSEMGCLSPDNREAKPNPAHPITQPLGPPQPPVDSGVRRYVAPPPFPEQPASFLAEPAPLARPPQWISEPPVATGRITGLRAVR